MFVPPQGLTKQQLLDYYRVPACDFESHYSCWTVSAQEDVTKQGWLRVRVTKPKEHYVDYPPPELAGYILQNRYLAMDLRDAQAALYRIPWWIRRLFRAH